jgi:hypothetical protein
MKRHDRVLALTYFSVVIQSTHHYHQLKETKHVNDVTMTVPNDYSRYFRHFVVDAFLSVHAGYNALEYVHWRKRQGKQKI